MTDLRCPRDANQLQTVTEHGIEVDLEVFLGNRRTHSVRRFTNQFGIKHGKF